MKAYICERRRLHNDKEDARDCEAFRKGSRGNL
jgi:hypothetical protein